MKNEKMNRQELISLLRTLKPVLEDRYRIRSIALFGSFARDEQTQSSDIDLLVEFEEEADLFDLVGASQYLEKHLHRPVDLVSSRALGENLQESVRKDVVFV
ncbi:DNA polymerase beta domain protein region [Spirochaeta thermophila DSM 6578]|uniref:DNA polymerase beta domain protein region n=2 Tax=Winmispira thermophila TaxID=154 RepID=G0GB82_WINT7|nr:DNA polymerase beta domain protein region [Spirochaeta thermophila DSM 6578]